MTFITTWIAPMLWVAGLALMLAVASYRHYDRTARGSEGFMVGGLLVAVGAMVASVAWWERLGWGAVLVLLLLSLRPERGAAP